MYFSSIGYKVGNALFPFVIVHCFPDETVKNYVNFVYFCIYFSFVVDREQVYTFVCCGGFPFSTI